ncbi:hypothetical protein BUALT_Bualt08G0132200 [Buddleja alternifolia]|uniref:Uncharacterized protein n=1 Tax=Buddleja alternifolia TaxID=168488 RepID=A0AAV6XCN4_9LAMI|nr:hypothetical protein BUALT_Bualt08G0132200 [Buddleja alternifolia]
MRSSLSHIVDLVSCPGTNDAVRRTHTQPHRVDPPLPVYRPTFESQTQFFHPTPDPQAQGFNYGGEDTSYRRSDSSDTLIHIEMLFSPTETSPQNQSNISPIHLDWDMNNSRAPPEQEYVTQEDQPPSRNDQQRRSERISPASLVYSGSECLSELTYDIMFGIRNTNLWLFLHVLLLVPSLDKGVELDCQWVEFDDVRYHIQATMKNLNILLLSISLPTPPPETVFFGGLPAGAIEAIKAAYGVVLQILDPPRDGFNLTVKLNLSKLPPDEGSVSSLF